MYLLDTNHCSRLIDGDPRILRALGRAGSLEVSVSAITRGELAYMVERSKRREENAVKISAFLRGVRVLPVVGEIADLYGILKGSLVRHFSPREGRRRAGVEIERLGFRENDLWIAATALHHSLVVVTADGDFERMAEAIPDLKRENWLGR